MARAPKAPKIANATSNPCASIVNDVKKEIEGETKLPPTVVGPAAADFSAQWAVIADQLDALIGAKVVAKVQRLNKCNKPEADFAKIRDWCGTQRDTARTALAGPQIPPPQWAAWMLEFKTYESYAIRFYSDFDDR